MMDVWARKWSLRFRTRVTDLTWGLLNAVLERCECFDFVLTVVEIMIIFCFNLYTRREIVHYRQDENPFVKILLTQNEYRLESNILLLRQKINFLC